MMKKAAWIVGSAELVLGLMTLAATSILQQVIPKLGYIAFQSKMAGSYSALDYKMDFLFPNCIGILLCLLGLGSIIYFMFPRKPLK